MQSQHQKTNNQGGYVPKQKVIVANSRNTGIPADGHLNTKNTYNNITTISLNNGQHRSFQSMYINNPPPNATKAVRSKPQTSSQIVDEVVQRLSNVSISAFDKQ